MSQTKQTQRVGLARVLGSTHVWALRAGIVLVSYIEPLALRQKISLMVRPTGFETFSSFSNLPYQTAPLPAPFPPDSTLRSENLFQHGKVHYHVVIWRFSRMPVSKSL